MNSLQSERDPFEQLVEAFLARYRAGERPSVSEYAEQHPNLADQIRELFPALVVMEEHRPPGKGPANLFPKIGDVSRIPEQLGEYRLLREVGRGGMGVVYEAVQESLGRHVALKVLPFNTLVSPKHLERFRREARAAAGLHHTNIVPVYGVGEYDGFHFYAMQFIQGQGLDEVLQEVKRWRGVPKDSAASSARAGSIADSLLSGRFAVSPVFPSSPLCISPRPWGEIQRGEREKQEPGAQTELTSQTQMQYFRSVARLGEQVAEALDYAHRQGVLHRDIKPSNLLLDTTGQVWVTDFGLAKTEDSGDLTQPGDLVGTLCYLAPERLQGKVDARSDVYSLGITLYELLTMRPPFENSDRALLVERIRREDPVRPRKLDARVPRDLETIVLKALAKDPGQRYRSAAALAEDLRRFLADRPIRARRTAAGERVWRWCRRNPLASAFILSLLLLALVTTVAAWWLNQERGKAREAEQAKEAERTTALANLDRAVKAEEERTAELCRSYLHQAQAGRLTGLQGQSHKGLQAIRRVMSLVGPNNLTPEQIRDLRNEAIACLATPDLRAIKEQNSGEERYRGGYLFDPLLERYTYIDGKGDLVIRRFEDNHIEDRLPPPCGFWWVSGSFSPDGRFLQVSYFTKVDEGTEVVWDLHSGQKVLQEPMFGGCDFRPDSRGLAISVAEDHTIRIYQLPERKEIRRLGKDFFGSRLRFDPSGRRLAVANHGGDTLMVLDVESKREIASFRQRAGVEWLDWSPDGRWLAVPCLDRRIYVYDVGRQRLQSVLEGHDDGVFKVSFNSMGTFLASSSWDGTTRLWDPVSGKQWVRAKGELISFSPDGRRLGFRKDSTFGHWEINCGEVCRTLNPGFVGNQSSQDEIDQAETSDVDFHKDGKVLASGGRDAVRLWDTASGRELASLPMNQGKDNSSAVRFDPRGGALITHGFHELNYWPMIATPLCIAPQRREEIQREESSGGGVRIGPPRLQYRTGTGWAQACWDDRGNRLAITDPQERQVIVLAINPTGESVVLFRSDGNQEKITIAMSPDGKWAAATTWGTAGVKVWDCGTGIMEAVRPGGRLEDHALGVAFSRDNQWLVVSSMDGYRWLQVVTWKPGPVVRDSKAGWHFSPAFSHDGSLLAIAATPQTVRLAQPHTGQEFATLTAPDAHVITGMALSWDGSQLAAATRDHAIQLWDLRALRQQLAAFGLDWNLPPYALSGVARPESSTGVLSERDSQPRPSKSQGVPPFEVDLGGLAWELPAIPAKEKDIRAGLYSLLISLDPWNYQWYYQRGRTYMEMGRPQEGVDDYQRAWLLGPSKMKQQDMKSDPVRQREFRDTPTRATLDRGTYFAGLGQWDRAAADYGWVYEREPPAEPFYWFQHAYLRLQVGDVDGYRKVCRNLVERWGKSKDFDQVIFLAHTCVLGPEALRDPAQVLKLAEQRMAMTPPGSDNHRWSVHVMGLAYYRAGRYQEAADFIGRLRATPPWDYNVVDWLVLALAYQQLGKEQEARKWLNQADQLINETLQKTVGSKGAFAPPGWKWRDWLGVQLLRAEFEETGSRAKRGRQ